VTPDVSQPKPKLVPCKGRSASGGRQCLIAATPAVAGVAALIYAQRAPFPWSVLFVLLAFVSVVAALVILFDSGPDHE
jgi:hypothetical protein